MPPLGRSSRHCLVGAVVCIALLLTGGTRPTARALTSCPCIPLPDGVIGWWPGDGNALDYVGQHHGVLVDGVTFNAGRFGQAFELDWSQSYVAVPDPDGTAFPLDSLTVEAWIYPNSVDAVRPIIDKYGPPGGDSWGLNIHNWYANPPHSSEGVPGFYVSGSWDFSLHREIYTTDQVFWPGQWYHVAGTFDVGTQVMKIYVNGVEAASTFNPDSREVPSVYRSTSPIMIGTFITGDGSKGGVFHGLVDEVTLYDRALTPGEILNIHASASGKCSVTIDVMPGTWPNAIRLGSSGSVPVGIFSTATFDARTIDPGSVTLAGARLGTRGRGAWMYSHADLTGDGLLDMIVHFDRSALGLSPTETQVILVGSTWDGRTVTGRDYVTTMR